MCVLDPVQSNHQRSEEVKEKEKVAVSVFADNCEGPWEGYSHCQAKMDVSQLWCTCSNIIIDEFSRQIWVGVYQMVGSGLP